MKKTALIVTMLACVSPSISAVSASVPNTHNQKLLLPDIAIAKTKPGTTEDFSQTQDIFNKPRDWSNLRSNNGGFGIRHGKRKDKPVRLVV